MDVFEDQHDGVSAAVLLEESAEGPVQLLGHALLRHMCENAIDVLQAREDKQSLLDAISFVVIAGGEPPPDGCPQRLRGLFPVRGSVDVGVGAEDALQWRGRHAVTLRNASSAQRALPDVS